MTQETNQRQISSQLAEFLKKIAINEKFTEFELIETSGCKYADGFLGDLIRIEIKGKRNGVADSLSLVCKLSPQNPFRRKMFNLSAIFQREIYVYETLLPCFMQFQNDKMLDDASGFFSFPKCYGCISDDDTEDYAIILEDLRSNGFQMLDKFAELDLDHASMVIKEIGKLHSISLAFRDQRPDLIEKFKSLEAVLRVGMLKHGAYNLFQMVNIDKAISTLDGNETKLIEKMNFVKDNFVRIVSEVLHPLFAEPFGVINHGDVWNNNLLYKYDTCTMPKPIKVSMVDWQQTQFASPALDVVEFLFKVIGPTLREKHYADFLNIYYKSLRETFIKLGSDPKRLFTFSELESLLKKFGMFILFETPMSTQVITGQPEDAVNFEDVAWQMAEMAKVDSDFVPNFNIFGSIDQPFKHRMAAILRDAEKFGYLN